jgi:diadenosine tetraphosphate (Ap4A) HIT family hydrolase
MTKVHPETNQENCIFCKIASGEVETPGMFWQDDEFMAFLSIFPNTKGFSVVISKEHHPSDMLSLDDGLLTKFVRASKEASKVLMKTFKDVGRVALIMEGMGVDHAHIKLSPMHRTEHLKEGVWKEYASGRNDFFEQYSGFILSSNGPKADPEELAKIAEELRKNA